MGWLKFWRSQHDTHTAENAVEDMAILTLAEDDAVTEAIKSPEVPALPKEKGKRKPSKGRKKPVSSGSWLPVDVRIGIWACLWTTTSILIGRATETGLDPHWLQRLVPPAAPVQNVLASFFPASIAPPASQLDATVLQESPIVLAQRLTPTPAEPQPESISLPKSFPGLLAPPTELPDDSIFATKLDLPENAPLEDQAASALTAVQPDGYPGNTNVDAVPTESGNKPIQQLALPAVQPIQTAVAPVAPAPIGPVAQQDLLPVPGPPILPEPMIPPPLAEAANPSTPDVEIKSYIKLRP